MIMKQVKVDVSFWSQVYSDAILRACEGMSEVDAADAMEIARKAVSAELDNTKYDGGHINNQD